MLLVIKNLLLWVFKSGTRFFGFTTLLLGLGCAGSLYYAHTEHVKALSVASQTELQCEKGYKEQAEEANSKLEKLLEQQQREFQEELKKREEGIAELRKAKENLHNQVLRSKEELENVYKTSKTARKWRDTPIPPAVLDSLRNKPTQASNQGSNSP